MRGPLAMTAVAEKGYLGCSLRSSGMRTSGETSLRTPARFYCPRLQRGRQVRRSRLSGFSPLLWVWQEPKGKLVLTSAGTTCLRTASCVTGFDPSTQKTFYPSWIVLTSKPIGVGGAFPNRTFLCSYVPTRNGFVR